MNTPISLKTPITMSHNTPQRIPRYAVIGASSGTGQEIVRLLESRGHHVRAIARRAIPATECVEPFQADVTDPQAIARALEGEFDAVFFTADIHQAFASREAVRALMVDGCVNAIEGARKNSKPPVFVLLSVIGPDKPSWVWHLLNLAKRGMRKNIADRESALARSGLPYVIVRAARLVNASAGHDELAALSFTPAQLALDMKRTMSRKRLASTLVTAAQAAPHGSVWDAYESDIGTTPMWLQTTAPQTPGV